MAQECQLAGTANIRLLGTNGFIAAGQFFDTGTIVDRLIKGVAFRALRTGSTPGATLTMTIRRFNVPDTVIGDLLASQLWGDVDDVPLTSTWIDVTFAGGPVLINERVRILLEWAGPPGEGNTQAVWMHNNTTDVKPNERQTRWDGTAWINTLTWDHTYCYTWGQNPRMGPVPAVLDLL